MKLVKQIVLQFQEGSSDKVYEIDLCELGAGKYVVNYRYGRRGARLQEGSQTNAAVPLAEAQKVFDKLAESKIKKGYRNVTAGAAAPAPTAGPKSGPAKAKGSTEADKIHYRGQAVLKRLQAGQGKPADWPLDRAIWRAGELRLTAAAPILIRLIGSAPSGSQPRAGALRDYCIAWALGRLGDQAAVEPLVRLWRASSTPDQVRRIAVEALRQLSDPEARAEMGRDLIAELPIPLRKPAASGTVAELLAALRAYLEPPAAAAPVAAPAKPKRASDDDDDEDEEDDEDEAAAEISGDPQLIEVLESFYLIDSETVRAALIEFLRTAPLRPNYFKALRHIFKAAEYRRDGEVFGLLAYRFEKERAFFRLRYYGARYVQLKSGMMSIKRKDVRAELAHEESQIAFGEKTRDYLRRRTWRTLMRMGEIHDLEYVRMAVGVLLPFTDADAVPVRRRSRRNWDIFAPYWAFNHILYGKSARYAPQSNAKAWHCRPKYKPGDPEPALREEAFQRLWNERPQGLLHLLAESECRPVHSFAVKTLRSCTAFLGELDSEAIVMLLGRPYEVTAQLGAELAIARYQPTAPDHALLLALASCEYAAGRAQALRWLDEKREHFLADSDLVLALCLNRHADTRAFALRLLRSAALPEAAARALIVRMVAHLMSLGASDADKAQARDVAAILLQSLGTALKRVGMRVLMDLLRHPLAEVQELGANLLLQHESSPAELPAGELAALLRTLIASPFESVRALGMRLLAQIPDKILLGHLELLQALCTHQLADLRNAVRPLIRRLATGNRELGAQLALLFVEALHHKESAEGLHAHLVRLLREDLAAGLAQVPRAAILRLCTAKSTVAVELGGQLLSAHLAWADETPTHDIVRLGSVDVKSVRAAAWAMFSRILPRLKRDATELAQGVRLLEAKWDDTKEFAFRTIRTEFSAQHFTPELLVGICDSVKPDVQALGCELITKFFEEDQGHEYLLKLSEHPTTELQRFATNYLERFAAGDTARLQKLRPYFVSVLSRVNKGRLAKSRVYTFLIEEARKSAAAGQLAAEILERVSATMAIGDRARAIESMVEISHLYPEVTLPISVRTPEVRSGV